MDTSALAAAQTNSNYGMLDLADHEVEVLNLPLVDIPLEKAAQALINSAVDKVRHKVYFMNAHCFNIFRRNPTYRRIVSEASVLFPDGIGMAIASKIEGKPIENNVNGTDLSPLIFERAAAQAIPIAMYGAEPGRVNAMAERLMAQHPGLQIVWADHGYYSPGDTSRIISEINASGAEILFVGKGVPLQEIWIHNHFDELAPSVVLGVGALFDYGSGSVPRAPQFLRKLRLEWLFRLGMEPRRLFLRYVVGNPLFLATVTYRYCKNRLARLLPNGTS